MKFASEPLTKPKTIDEVKAIVKERLEEVEARIAMNYAKAEEWKDTEHYEDMKKVHWDFAGHLKPVASELRIVLARLDGEYTKAERLAHELSKPEVFEKLFEESRREHEEE